MAKIFNFLIVMVVLTGVLYLAGLNTNNLNILKVVNDLFVGDVESSGTWGKWLSAVLGVVAISSVTAAIFGNANAAKTIGAAGLVIYFISYAADFFSILSLITQKCGDPSTMTGLCSVSYYSAWIILAPLAVGYVYSLIVWVIGEDN